MNYDIRRATGQAVQNRLYLAVERRSLPEIVQTLAKWFGIEWFNRVLSRLRRILVADQGNITGLVCRCKCGGPESGETPAAPDNIVNRCGC